MGHRKLPWSMGRISTSGSLTNVGVVVRHQQIMLREACDHSEWEYFQVWEGLQLQVRPHAAPADSHWERPCECKECGKVWDSSAFVQNNFPHPRESLFKYKVYQRAFCDHSSLTLHEESRWGKPCGYSECEHTFSLRSSLMHPLSVRTGEKPCECKRCGKAFCKWTYLSQHQRTHTGENVTPEENVCQRKPLARHLRNYTKEKP
ncbi:hypothetical protein GH733_017340, partial [Mirounga leonina]